MDNTSDAITKEMLGKKTEAMAPPSNDITQEMLGAKPVDASTPQIPENVKKAKQYIGAQDYNGLCQAFVEDTSNNGGWDGASAIDAWNNQLDKASSDLSKMKPGDRIYFAPDASNDYFGHTGIYEGDNKFISATYNGVEENDLDAWQKQTGQQLLGYIK
jgi:NlpC/P60 family protein